MHKLNFNKLSLTGDNLFYLNVNHYFPVHLLMLIFFHFLLKQKALIIDLCDNNYCMNEKLLLMMVSGTCD